MKRRQCLIDFEVDGIGKEAKEDHMFDVRYYPEEYLSDIQEEDSEWLEKNENTFLQNR